MYDLFDIKPRGFYSKHKVANVDFKIEWSDERKKQSKGKFAKEKNPFFGKKHSKITKEKMSKNHADFTGDKNPFKIACKNNPQLLVNLSKSKEEYWANKSFDEKYVSTRHKNCIYEDISKRFWSQLINNAKSRNIEFCLTPEELWSIWISQSECCKLSGMKLNIKANREITASVDRIDSSIGYTKSNIQIVHKHINVMKLDHNNDYFIYLCQIVALYNI
jgi:hypothetical protein